MNASRTITDDVIERMLQRRAARGDLTGLVQAVRDVVDGTAQDRRSGWWSVPRKMGWTTPRVPRAITAAAAVIVLSVAAITILGRPSGPSEIGTGTFPPPTATAPTSASPRTSILPTAEPSPASSTEPGSHTTLVFEPRLSFVLPEGWRLESENRARFELTRGGRPIEVVAHPYPPSIDADGCVTGSRMGARAADLLAYWASNPQLNASKPERVAIGDSEGWLVVVSKNVDQSTSCPEASGGDLTIGFSHLWNRYGSQFITSITDVPETFIVGDLPDGTTIAIELPRFDSPQLLDEATAMIESFELNITP